MPKTSEYDPHEYLPVESHPYAVIEAYRGGRLAGSDEPRFYVTLSIPATDNQALIGILASNLKSKISVHFGDVQLPLPEEVFEDDSPQGKLVYTAGNGEPILPHPFKASEEDGAKCTFCELGESSDVHVSQTAASLIEESRREVPSEERAEAEASLASRSRS